MGINTDPADQLNIEFGSRTYSFEDHTTANIAKSLWRVTPGGNQGFEDVLGHKKITYSVEDNG